MSRSSRHDALREIERSRLQHIAAQFNAAWQTRGVRDSTIHLAAFLPVVGDPLRIVTLYELIPTDMDYRWARGEAKYLEHYVEEFPELRIDELPPELICSEYDVRCRHGDTPTLETYEQRFPRQFPAVREIIASALSATAPAGSSSTPGGTSGGTGRGTPTATPTPARQTLKAGETRRGVSGTRKVAAISEGYQLLEPIGKGNYGEVMRALAPGGIEVAVKLVHWTSSDRLTQTEMRALELMKGLKHAFLVQVQAYWLAEGQLHIVMELADGSLEKRFHECRDKGLMGIPVDELLRYMHEAAEALDYLHSKQVLHRDVKPANILLLGGHAKLADFGLARLCTNVSTDITATMTGTPLYMGPEVWDKKVGPASDQYSLASTYVELRLGRPLFEATTQHEVMLKHLTAEPDLKPLPEAEQRVLRKALSKKSEHRYPTCAAFVAELKQAVEGQPTPTTTTRRTAIFVILAGALAVPALYLSWEWFFPLLPPGTQKAPGARAQYVSSERHWYWDRVVKPLPGDAAVTPIGDSAEASSQAGDASAGAEKTLRQVTFVLVPKHANLPRSFYIMEHKVWNELFAAFNEQFVKEHGPLTPSDWPDAWATAGATTGNADMPAADHPHHPVMGVTHKQAEQFAKWLGGSLPSVLQWDAAAGTFWNESDRQGPYRGKWEPAYGRLKVAVDRKTEGTMKVGEASDDISPFGCRDMSGNGMEWTSTKKHRFEWIALRGYDYGEPRPLMYADLEKVEDAIGSSPPDATDPVIGFRVILEMADRGSPGPEAADKAAEPAEKTAEPAADKEGSKGPA